MTTIYDGNHMTAHVSSPMIWVQHLLIKDLVAHDTAV